MSDITNYRPNSNSSRANSDSQNKKIEKKVEKVVTGDVITKKKGTLQKLGDIFLPNDITNIKDYFLMDIIVPSLKKGLHEIGQAIIDEMFGGSRRRGSEAKVQYGNCYSSGKDRDSRRPNTRYVSTQAEYDDLIFDTRSNAERVLDGMYDILDKFHIASVSDLYDLAGVSTNNYNLNDYGWTDIRGAQIVHTRDGYLLKMPRAMPLD